MNEGVQSIVEAIPVPSGRVPDWPEHMEGRGPAAMGHGRWAWLRRLIYFEGAEWARRKGIWVRWFDVDNKREADCLISAAQNCKHTARSGRYCKLPEGFVVRTAKEPLGSTRDGKYKAWVKVIYSPLNTGHR